MRDTRTLLAEILHAELTGADRVGDFADVPRAVQFANGLYDSDPFFKSTPASAYLAALNERYGITYSEIPSSVFASVFARTVEDLDLGPGAGTRARFAIQDLRWVGYVVRRTPQELKRKNFGRGSLHALEEALRELDSRLTLGMDVTWIHPMEREEVSRALDLQLKGMYLPDDAKLQRRGVRRVGQLVELARDYVCQATKEQLRRLHPALTMRMKINYVPPEERTTA